LLSVRGKRQRGEGCEVIGCGGKCCLLCVLALACWCEFILQTITVKKHVYIAQIYQKPHSYTHTHEGFLPFLTPAHPFGMSFPPLKCLSHPFRYVCVPRVFGVGGNILLGVTLTHQKYIFLGNRWEETNTLHAKYESNKIE